MTNEHKEFMGLGVEPMSELLAGAYIPASTAEIMKRRINNEEFFMDGEFDTSDFLAYKKRNSKKVKFLFAVNNQNEITDQGREILNMVCDESNFKGDYFDLKGRYDSLKGDGVIEISLEDSERDFKIDLEKGTLLDNRLFRILARHPDEVPEEYAYDENLLKEYVKLSNHDAFFKVGDNSHYERLNSWSICSSDMDFSVWSDFDSKFDSKPYKSRFAGLATEKSRKIEDSKIEKMVSLSNKSSRVDILKALRSGKTFEYNGILYAPVKEE